MSRSQEALEATLIASHFNVFVRHAFRMVHGKKLGDQPYVEHMCHVISRLIEGKNTRLLINLPPQHLKSFVGTVGLAVGLGHSRRTMRRSEGRVGPRAEAAAFGGHARLAVLPPGPTQPGVPTQAASARSPRWGRFLACSIHGTIRVPTHYQLPR